MFQHPRLAEFLRKFALLCFELSHHSHYISPRLGLAQPQQKLHGSQNLNLRVAIIRTMIIGHVLCGKWNVRGDEVGRSQLQEGGPHHTHTHTHTPDPSRAYGYMYSGWKYNRQAGGRPSFCSMLERHGLRPGFWHEACGRKNRRWITMNAHT